jgi:hypothetical protein
MLGEGKIRIRIQIEIRIRPNNEGSVGPQTYGSESNPQHCYKSQAKVPLCTLNLANYIVGLV